MTEPPQEAGADTGAESGATAAGPTSTDLAGAEEPARIGRNELGRIDVAPRAVEKMAAWAAVEIGDAGGAGAKLLGRSLPGMRKAGLTTLPKVSADIDGPLVFLEVELSVRWPAPVGQVAETVRQHLFRHLGDLVGLQVREVNIEVVDLITEVESARVS